MRIIFIIIILFSAMTSFAAQQSFQSWLKNFKKQAVSQGINPVFFDDVFDGMTIGRRQIHFDRTQPERRLTFLQYRNKRADAYRIKLGRKEFKKNKQLLDGIAAKYGVDPCYIVSIWGMETSYGRFMGGFDVIRSLATLAYEGRRGTFFRRELIHALHILQDGHVTRKQFRGEWAGGSGHTQFLPSSWRRYAVDHSGDNKKDIWNNKADALASIANYLKLNGWDYHAAVRVQVILPHHFNQRLIGYKIKRSLRTWVAMGIKAAPGWHMPAHNYQASIIHPYGGPDFMIFNNWRVIMSYNNSSFYAGTISYMADKICRRS